MEGKMVRDELKRKKLSSSELDDLLVRVVAAEGGKGRRNGTRRRLASLSLLAESLYFNTSR